MTDTAFREAGRSFFEAMIAWWETEEIDEPAWAFALGMRAAFDHPEWAQWALQRCADAEAALAPHGMALRIVHELPAALHILDDPRELIDLPATEEAIR